MDGSLLAWFGSGEAIVEEGTDGDSLFFLLRGRVEVLKTVAPDRVVSVTELGPGELIGEMTLFLDTPRSATVRAVEECLLLQVRRNCVGSLIKRNPDLLDRFAAIVSAREAELANLDHSSQPLQSNVLLETMRRLVEVFKGG